MSYTDFTARGGGSNLYAGTLDGAAEAATAPLATYTNGNWNSGTGVFTPVSGNPVTDGVAVGHFASVYNDGAAAPAVFIARVTAVSSTTITVSTSIKSGTAPTTSATARTMVVGGAHAGPSGASAFPLDFITSALVKSPAFKPRINLKNDQSYLMSAGITVPTTLISVEGYSSSFGDGGRSILSANGGTFTVLTVTGTATAWKYLIFTGNVTGTTVPLVTTSVRSLWVGCVFHDSFDTGFQSTSVSAAPTLVECEAYLCGKDSTTKYGMDLASAILIRCDVHDCTQDGVLISTVNGPVSMSDCVVESNGNKGVSVLGTGNLTIKGGVVYNNGADGISSGALASTVYIENVAFVNNGTFAINLGVTASWFAINCAFFGNFSGTANGTQAQAIGSITLTANPFVDAPNGDFRLNSTAGGGTAAKGVGRGAFTQTAASYAGAVGYPDVGGMQHLEPTPPVGGTFIVGQSVRRSSSI